MDVALVLSRLEAVKPGSRPNLWNCRCPVRGRHAHGDRRPSGRVWVDERTGKLHCWCAKGCRWKEWVQATGTRPADWFPADRVADRPPARGNKVAKPVEYYDYTDEQGALLYQVIRTDPKGFWQRRPVPGFAEPQWAFSLSPGRYTYSARDGYWIQVLVENAKGAVELGEVRRVPYRLPDLVDPAKQAHPVLIAEGEGKVDLLRSLGFVATCAAGGAGKWPFGFGGHLTGRRVVVLPDMDDVGMSHAWQVAASCMAFGCQSVRVVSHGMGWEELPKAHDVKDWLSIRPADRQKAELIDLIKLQREWKPAGVAA